jgi:hypothetical protein
LRVTLDGLITRPHDVKHTEALVEGFSGLVPADKGFIDPYRQQLVQ